MLTLFVPPAIREVYFLFKDIFFLLGFSYDESCALLVYFLLGAGGISDFVRKCPWSPSVSSLCRAAEKFVPNRFMKRNRKRILKKLQERDHGDFCFAVDDTANPKYGSSVLALQSFDLQQAPSLGRRFWFLLS